MSVGEAAEQGRLVIDELELIEQAAAHVGLTLMPRVRHSDGFYQTRQTDVLHEWNLSDVLAERVMCEAYGTTTEELRRQGCRPRRRFELVVKANVYWPNDGIYFSAWGGFGDDYEHGLTVKALKIIVSEPDAPTLPEFVHRTVDEDGVLVPWVDLGLEGLVPIFKLFEVFSGGSKAVMGVGGHNSTIYDPDPFGSCYHPHWYVTRDNKPKVLAAWRKQLTSYRDSLKLPDEIAEPTASEA